MEFFTRSEFEAAADVVRQRTRQQPRVGIVLGSGLGDFAESIENADVIPYDDIPHWPHSTVVGHQGQLYLGQLEGQDVMVMRGRAHSYEGYAFSHITLPIRVMQLMGVETVILTNAAGGLNPTFTPGDLMLIDDHINLMGSNPLRGPNDDSLGTRFPDMQQAYDPALRRIALEVACSSNVPMHEGVYIGLAGPSFETPAEVRFLRTIGGDAVGMSTVPEVIVARHGGLRVLGISGITNAAVADAAQAGSGETTHDEVLETGRVLVPRLETILRGVLQRLPAVS